MSWHDPLRHLPPLSEHPSASPSLSPALSDTSVSFLGASVRIDSLKDEHYSAWKTLSSFFEHLGHAGKCNLAADVENCVDTDQLLALANHLLDAILKPFKLAGGQAPIPLTTPPTAGAEDSIDTLMATIDASTRADQGGLRHDCLRRDNYRCVLSGKWDSFSVFNGIVVPPPGFDHTPLQCAHILPFALGAFDDSSALQTRNKAIIWFALHRYFPDISDLIDARSINQSQNAIMLDTGTHLQFGSYFLAFLPRGGNDYQATWCTDSVATASTPGPLSFKIISHDKRVPMPNPEFFKVHYIVSKILQVSGLRETITMAADKAFLDLDCRQLQSNGSTDAGAILSRLMLMDIRVGGDTGTR